MAASPISLNPESREVRLGLVLYGGVSLAVYMNGVANEFFNAVRGRGVYKLIKALSNSDVVVDIISGTSAGGINGVFLAYALCNAREFGDFAQLWREHADISRLLRKPEADASNCESLLDSEGYYQSQLENAFATVRDVSEAVKKEEWASGDSSGKVKELDLFITGTNVDGNIFTQIDDAGHAITVNDYRSVFILKHRLGRKEPFSLASSPAVTHQALAKLGRITSSFPAAFAPVHLPGGAEDLKTVDGKLREWGNCALEANFLDGGILHNKPFSYTIKEIFYRMANREVERFLLYVEPDPERFEAQQAQELAGQAWKPNFLTSITSSLISLPGYQSISADLQALAEHNTRVRQYNLLTEKVQSDIDKDRQRARTIYQESPAHNLHDRCRLMTIGQRAIQGILKEPTAGGEARLNPEESSAAQSLIVEFFALLESDHSEENMLQNFDVYFRIRRLFRLIYLIREMVYHTRPRTIGAQDVERYRKLRLALNRQIELLQIVQSALEDLVDRARVDWLTKDVDGKLTNVPAQIVWGNVERLLRELLRLDTATGNRMPKDYAQAWTQADSAKSSLDEIQAHWLTQGDLNQFLDPLRKIIADAEAGKPLVENESVPFKSLLQETDRCEERMLNVFAPAQDDPVRKAYADFEMLDALLYPMELSGDLNCKDIIKTVRVSPLDAQRGFSRRSMKDKVTGTGFHHFGAFFKQSWRSNDILWGRLDGICQLAECLLTRKRLGSLMESGDGLRNVQLCFGLWDDSGQWTGRIPDQHPLHPARLFPSASPESQAALQSWLEQLLSANAALRQAALDKFPRRRGSSAEASKDDNPLELLIELAQFEVINESLPAVAEDAATEQLQWNYYKQPGKALQAAKKMPPAHFDPAQGAFMAGSGFLNPSVIPMAAAAAAMNGIELIKGRQPSHGATPAAMPLGEYFRNFKVGATDLAESLPAVVLLDILATAALVLRNCVLTALGPAGKKVEGRNLYRYFLDWPLRLFHSYLHWWRRTPADERYWRMVIWCVAAALLLVGVGARNLILFQPSGFSMLWFGVLIVAPAAVMILMVLLRNQTRTTVVLMLAIAVILSGSALAYVSKLLGKMSPAHAVWWLPNSEAVLALLLALALAYLAGFLWAKRKRSTRR